MLTKNFKKCVALYQAFLFFFPKKIKILKNK